MASRNKKHQRHKIKASKSTAFLNSPQKAISVGEFVWSKLNGCKWWPAIVIDSTDCGKSEAKFGYSWIFWFGDYKISEHDFLKITNENDLHELNVPLISVPKQRILNFVSCFHDMFKIPSSKLRQKAITEVLEILAGTVEYSYSSREDLFDWAKTGFNNLQIEKNAFIDSLPPLVSKHLNRFKTGDEEQEDSDMSDCERSSEAFIEKLQSGVLKIEEVCLACRGKSSSVVCEHPYFSGSLCQPCKERVKESAFAIGDDSKNMCCLICAEPGFLVLCENVNCPRSYCKHCMKFYLGSTIMKQILEVSSWLCFFCSNNGLTNSILKIKEEWEEKLMALFSSENAFIHEITPSFTTKKRITVLSLFDGIATGKLVLDMLGIHIDKYYCSEIDEDALNVIKLHHKDSVIHLGDVCKLTEDVIASLGQIDLVIGGSPCNDLSLVNPIRKGLYDFTGSGCLFFDFFHVLNLVRKENKHVFYLFENVASMSQKDKVIISSFLMHDPALIDAKYYSPQSRARYFWGNIPGLHSLTKFWNSSSSSVDENVLTDFILPIMGRKAVVEKIRTVTTQRNSLIQNNVCVMPVVMNGKPDVLWVTELERIFGFPLHYTDTGNLSITKRRELLGRAWSVPVIKAILYPLRNFFECD